MLAGIAKQHYHVAQLICLVEKREQVRLLNRLGVKAVLLSDILAGPSLTRRKWQVCDSLLSRNA